MIKKKTGIKSIADLLSFQPEEYFMEEIKGVVFERIDDRRLGEWIFDAHECRIPNIKRKDIRYGL